MPVKQYRVDGLYDKFGEPANLDRGGFETYFPSPRKWTAEIIKPLFNCVVKRPSVTLSKRDVWYQSLLRINVTDDDMPWKEKCHRMHGGKYVLG